ncbi:MAG: quinolinate synthase NadA [Candidatus Thermoplasmatota archaeon]|nr:quinolinate synthase NadA [Candidatus Thermoplasmatota archaeon]
MGDLNPTQQRIRELAREKDVIILAHNYQVPEVQDIADIIGDSLVLAMKATKAKQSVILFCGVDFMAESAKALSPEKKVIHPVPGAQCPMAHMVDVESLERFKEQHPGASVVAYVNTTAEIKAHSDICCTSANAVKVVASLPEGEVIMVPDTNLGAYVQSQLPDKKVLLWPGYCHVHQNITVEQIEAEKAKHPDALVIVHPECTMDVIELADRVASTEGMLRFAVESESREFIIGTEEGLAYRLSNEVPGKVFHRLETAICPNMKKIRLEDVLKALEDMGPEIYLDPAIIEGNRLPLERMLAVK